ncbi:MAG: histidine kinase dimerization/phospho-acceptor domain-containing protein, partial [Nitrospirota bacterium]
MNQRRPTYKLTYKLMTVIVGAGLLSIVIALVLVFFVQKQALTESLGEQFKTLANITSARVIHLLDQTVSEATLLGLDPVIRVAVERANRQYAGRSPEQIRSGIEQLTRQWERQEVPADLVRRYNDSDAATFLRRYLALPSIIGKYYSILVADKYGVLVASPAAPDSIDFSGEAWWQAAFDEGRGGYYIGDVSLASMESEKRYIIEFAVPIIDLEGRDAIGALVVVSTVSHLFSAVTGIHIGKDDHIMLAGSDGTLLFCPVFLIKNHTLKPELIAAISQPESGWTTTLYDVHYSGRESLNGFAPVTPTTVLNPKSFGGQHWYIFTSQNPNETYAPMTRLLTWVSIAGAGGLGLLGVAAIFFSHRFSKPIQELQRGAKLIGFGNLDYRLTIPTGDEIEELSHEFNEMANKLKTAYTGLEQRVAQRTRELEDRNRQLSILYAVSSSLSAATELRGLLSTVLATTTQQLGSLLTCIHLTGHKLPLHWSDEQGAADREELEHAVLQACHECMQPPAQAVRLKQAILRDEAPAALAGDGQALPAGRQAPTRAFILLTIPLVSKNRVVGAMVLCYPDGGGIRLEHDRYLLLTLGHQIGAAIEAAQLFEQTKKLDQLKSEFVSKVSHELRTPLTSIKGFGEILASYDDIDSTSRQEFVQIINEESDRLTRLINDLLDLSKIEAGKVEWVIQPIDVSHILRYTVKQMQAVAMKKPLTLTLDLPPALPLALGDRDQLVQVMENLLSNAIKFTPQGIITVGAQWAPDGAA